ncbi:hypothetical protein [Lysobacter solisilvae (ex Woo and Kim 2020)]|uniref:Uncharacterized protein n=1 Tax=Agrilutibacter terrestris TaxID=2865112 RepID=A0A7H0FX33_9GAMM|nr:hypothetical protein [Lysobacter terrestris]QNP40599.1 hypothetical protein H8B22_14215 [Lysobacter terrestris]
MALDRTAGFDMLVQISETEINAQLAAAFASGLIFPPSLSTPVNAFGITGTLDLNFGTPVADLDRPRPQMRFRVPFTNSQLEVTAPLPTTIAPLGGTIEIIDSVQMRTNGGTQQAVLDFTSGAPSVTVTFDGSTAGMLAPILGGFGLTVAQVQNQLAGIVQQRLVDDVQRLALTPPIPVANDADPLTPFAIEVTTVNDTAAADRDALTFGVRTDAASTGNINAITQSFIPAGAPSMVMMSNAWLLGSVVRPQLAAALGRPVTDFDRPLRLNRPVPAPGGQGTLTNLVARIEGNRIRVDGRATASGTGWSAVATFTFFVSLTLSGGQIQITATTPVVDVDVSMEWWVWLASAFLGGLFGGIIGAIVGAIVPAIVESIVEGMAERMATDAFNNATSSIPPIPLGPIGAGLNLTSILLDDLELRGNVMRSLNLPVKSSGHYVTSGAFTLDLDKGTVHAANSQMSRLDLAWHPANGLDSRNGAGMTVSGAGFGSLTPVQLRAMAFASQHLSPWAIPLSFELPLFGMHSEIVVGVRTNEGRLAKVRAWRDLQAGGALNIHWVTYDTPVPSLDIALRWSVLETGESQPFVGKDFASCTRTTVSRRCTIEAWPRLMVFPVDYQWCLCGKVLEPGEGEVEHAGGTLRYELAGRHLTIETGMGDAVDCELCVSAIDARGRELFTCVPLEKGPMETACGPGRKFYPRPRIELVPCDPLLAIANWESVLSPRVQEAFRKAMVDDTGGKGTAKQREVIR